MTKKILALAMALALCLCLALSAGAFASGEASGEASGGSSGGPPPGMSVSAAVFAVTADGVEELDAEDVTFSGSADGQGASGFTFESTETSLATVHGDDAEEGAVSFILGGGAANFDAAALDIYPAAQAKLGFESFDSAIDTTAGPAAMAWGGAYLELDGIYGRSTTGIVTAGSDNDRNSGSDDSDYIDTVVVLRNSYLESDTGADIADVNWPHATSLMVRGSNRTALSIGESETYYYGTGVVVDGWAAMATDDAVA